MDTATVLGLLLAWGALIGSVLIEGGDLRGLVNISAAVLVFGGTAGAAVIGCKMKNVLSLPSVLRAAFLSGDTDPSDVIQEMVGYADKARREGLLALEATANRVEDDFVRRGLILVVDGADPQIIRDILRTEVENLETRHMAGSALLNSMGGFAPTLGIIGTVMGLVNMLANLSTPSKMGPMIASAFTATLYGVCSANLVFLPLANKLKVRSREEVLIREIQAEGLLSVQAGDNPRIVEQRLKAYLSPRSREMLGEVYSGAE